MSSRLTPWELRPSFIRWTVWSMRRCTSKQALSPGKKRPIRLPKAFSRCSIARKLIRNSAKERAIALESCIWIKYFRPLVIGWKNKPPNLGAEATDSIEGRDGTHYSYQEKPGVSTRL